MIIVSQQCCLSPINNDSKFISSMFPGASLMDKYSMNILSKKNTLQGTAPLTIPQKKTCRTLGMITTNPYIGWCTFPVTPMSVFSPILAWWGDGRFRCMGRLLWHLGLLLKERWSVKLAYSIFGVRFFFRTVEMGSEMSQTVRFNILKVIDR